MSNPKSGIRRAFSAVEVVIVVAIVAVLFLAALPSYLRVQGNAQNVNAVKKLRSLAAALESYGADNNAYPAGNVSGLLGVDANSSGPFVYDVFRLLSTPVAYIADPLTPDEYVPTMVTGPISAGSGYYIPVAPVDGSTRIFKAMRYFTPDAQGLGTGVKPGYYLLASCGPDQTAPLAASLFDSDHVLDWGILSNIYDPTNGATGRGDIYRAGGRYIPEVDSEAPGALFMNIVQERGGYVFPDPNPPLAYEVGDAFIFPLDETIYTKYYEMNADHIMDAADIRASQQ